MERGPPKKKKLSIDGAKAASTIAVTGPIPGIFCTRPAKPGLSHAAAIWMSRIGDPPGKIINLLEATLGHVTDGKRELFRLRTVQPQCKVQLVDGLSPPSQRQARTKRDVRARR